MTAKPETKVDVAVIEERALKLDRQPGYHDMMALARTLLETGFLPMSIKTPGQALAIILTGQEMKLGPMQSLRSIGIINGKPVIAADLQLALFHRDGGKSKWEKLEADEAVLWLKHPNGVEHTEKFTMTDAEQAGLTARGDTYKKFPKAMLRSRAITAGLKSVGFEPVTGVYDPDELVGIMPTAEDLRMAPPNFSEKPKAFTASEPAMAWDVSATTEAVTLTPATPNEVDVVFKEAARAGLTKETFPAFYEQVMGREWRGLFQEDVKALLAETAQRIAAKGKARMQATP